MTDNNFQKTVVFAIPLVPFSPRILILSNATPRGIQVYPLTFSFILMFLAVVSQSKPSPHCDRETKLPRFLVEKAIFDYFHRRAQESGQLETYVGFKESKKPEIFKSKTRPTKETHPQYDFTYGPFKSTEEAQSYINAMNGLACGDG